MAFTKAWSSGLRKCCWVGLPCRQPEAQPGLWRLAGMCLLLRLLGCVGKDIVSGSVGSLMYLNSSAGFKTCRAFCRCAWAWCAAKTAHVTGCCTSYVFGGLLRGGRGHHARHCELFGRPPQLSRLSSAARQSAARRQWTAGMVCNLLVDAGC